jgi:hypothetical protein
MVSDEVAAVKDALVQRGLAEKQALRLTAGQGSSTLERMQAIVKYFDHLMYTKSPLVSRSPTGFLYRAVERPFEFVLPGEKRVKQNELGFVGPNTTAQRSNTHETASAASVISNKATKSASTKVNMEVLYLKARRERLDQVLLLSKEETRAELQSEVEQALHKLKSHISPQRFQEAVQHGVEQRLLERDGFPEFEQWMKSQQ